MSLNHSILYGKLVEDGHISQGNFDRAVEISLEENKRLSLVLIENQFLEQDVLTNFFNEVIDIPSYELNKSQIDIDLARVIPEDVVRKYNAVPLFLVDKILTIAVQTALDVDILEELESTSGYKLNVIQASNDQIRELINYCYLQGSKEVTDLDEMFELGLELVRGKNSDDDIEEIATEAPIAKLVDMILKQAIAQKASDIHIEPMENEIRVRYRIDGILQEASSPPKMLENALVSRVKIVSGLDITERRKPQDGRLTINVGDRTIDFRVSTVKVAWGEKIVLRILDKSSIQVSLDKIGFSPELYNKFMKTISKPSGILFITGPTGSGKTTTLYSALNKLNTPEKNIVTVEDPVEFNLASINQIPVNHKIGVTFATGLRTILRQDPDIIMIGEIRDLETASIAIQASQTGHFVFSTLHTNNAPAAATRLIDMGVQPFLIASSISGVLAQRLVRAICPICKKEYQLDSKEEIKYEDLMKDLKRVHGEDVKLYKGVGCKHCNNTGYKGRLGIFEFMQITEALQSLILREVTAEDLRKQAQLDGMKTMREDGLDKVASGATTIDEVMRVMSE